MAFTDQQIMEQIQYTVIEPPDLGATWPSGLWTADEVAQYLDQRQKLFLKDTHFQIGITDIAASDGVGLYDLPEDWIATVRVVWVDAEGNYKELTPSDSWEADNGIPTWSYVDGTPLLFNDNEDAPISIRVMPAPDEDGTIQIHYVPYSALLEGDGEIFTLPDEFVPVVKYGALADMFTKVGRAQDPRAKYCADRYQMGLEVARLLIEGFK